MIVSRVKRTTTTAVYLHTAPKANCARRMVAKRYRGTKSDFVADIADIVRFNSDVAIVLLVR